MTKSPHGAYGGLQEKVVLITGTGASSGIGAGCAEVFAANRSSLVLCGRNVENLWKTMEKCEARGLPKDKILLAPGDVTKQEDLETTIKMAVDSFGRLDVVVANAGMVVPGTIDMFTLDEYRQQLDTNLTSVFNLLRLTLPELKKTKGNVIAVSSIASTLSAAPMLTAYCVSKAGVDKLITCLAMEYAPHGVRVNCVNPGAIYTPIFGMKFEAVNEMAAKTHPIGRCGNVYETGKAIAFLASDDASFITGVSLKVDGGASLNGPGFIDNRVTR